MNDQTSARVGEEQNQVKLMDLIRDYIPAEILGLYLAIDTFLGVENSERVWIAIPAAIVLFLSSWFVLAVRGGLRVGATIVAAIVSSSVFPWSFIVSYPLYESFSSKCEVGDSFCIAIADATPPTLEIWANIWLLAALSLFPYLLSVWRNRPR